MSTTDYPQRAAAMCAEVAKAFAWPGGYPLVLLMADGESLCPACAEKHAHAIVEAAPRGDSWRAEGVYIHWEGPPIVCAHCGGHVPSAYDDSEGK